MTSWLLCPLIARPGDAELSRLIQKRVLEQSVCRRVVVRRQQSTPDVVSQIKVIPAPVPSQIRSFTQDDTTTPAATPGSVSGHKLETCATEEVRITGMNRYTSYGTCALCGKRTTKAGMSRHLKGCLAEHEPSRGKAARVFRLRIEDAYSPIFWMDVEMRANSTLEELDDFLRGEWLECCGHLSDFDIDGINYTVTTSYDMGPFSVFADPTDRTMNVELGEILSKGSRFQHTYDFGTSTELKLRVVDERQGRIGGESVRHLSQNEAPVWECEVCGENASWICTFCMYERENPFYCEHHAEDHDCDEPEMLLPVVNSPRMGMCGYTGPD